MNDRLTLNLGLRYDFVDGMPIDQSTEPELRGDAGRGTAGRFANVPLLEEFGQEPRERQGQLQPRIGFAYDVHGTGRDIIRGGWGVYTTSATPTPTCCSRRSMPPAVTDRCSS